MIQTARTGAWSPVSLPSATYPWIYANRNMKCFHCSRLLFVAVWGMNLADGTLSLYVEWLIRRRKKFLGGTVGFRRGVSINLDIEINRRQGAGVVGNARFANDLEKVRALMHIKVAQKERKVAGRSFVSRYVHDVGLYDLPGVWVNQIDRRDHGHLACPEIPVGSIALTVRPGLVGFGRWGQTEPKTGGRNRCHGRFQRKSRDHWGKDKKWIKEHLIGWFVWAGYHFSASFLFIVTSSSSSSYY